MFLVSKRQIWDGEIGRGDLRLDVWGPPLVMRQINTSYVDVRHDRYRYCGIIFLK